MRRFFANEVPTVAHDGVLGGAGLRRDGAQALYDQLAARLIEEVAVMRSGQRLPTETELMAAYGVSRTTVRSAVAALVERGLLVKRQGKGTFVNKPEVTHSLDHLSPFVAVLAAAGKESETRLSDFGWVTGAGVPSELGGPDARVLAFRRLYVSE